MSAITMNFPHELELSDVRERIDGKSTELLQRHRTYVRAVVWDADTLCVTGRGFDGHIRLGTYELEVTLTLRGPLRIFGRRVRREIHAQMNALLAA
jgi:hypothetical protein